MNTLNDQITADLTLHLEKFIKPNLPIEFFEAFQYALFPTGKLFRSNLVWKYFCDLNQIDITKINTRNYPSIQLLSSAVEIHHAYTLIHDDLPCMDNDDFRRGKLSTHKKFNEWIALLAGDGFLNLSFELLSEIEHPHTLELIKNFSKLCGPGGLILGQYLDLKQDHEEFKFENILKIHELKTSNLFICCLLGSAILSTSDEKTKNRSINLGKNIGILFQLIDDLTELCDLNISNHEKQINPWVHDYQLTTKSLIEISNSLKGNLELYPYLEEMISNYISKTKTNIEKNKQNIEAHLKNDLSPIIERL